MNTRTFALGLAVLSLAMAGLPALGQEPATPADPCNGRRKTVDMQAEPNHAGAARAGRQWTRAADQ